MQLRTKKISVNLSHLGVIGAEAVEMAHVLVVVQCALEVHLNHLEEGPAYNQTERMFNIFAKSTLKKGTKI